MNELTLYGICLAVTIILLVVVATRKGLEVLLRLILVAPCWRRS